MKILILHGVNLCMLGRRNPEIYGTMTETDLLAALREYAPEDRIDLFSTNHEPLFIERVYRLMGGSYDALIVNPGAWTHYSYAIADAIEMLSIPVVEVHLSDVTEREEFRKISVLEHVRTARFAGGGIEAYKKAIDYLKGENDEKSADDSSAGGI